TMHHVDLKLKAYGIATVHDVHSMVRIGFSPAYWYVPVFYIIAMAMFCFHLMHGISSMVQSLGLRDAVWKVRLDRAALVIAVVVFIGFASIPLAGRLGMIEPNPLLIAAH
ncbi:MAG TPA: hypothetical protein VK995_03430, partial [Oceanipulchritudo sp.]|nr:hypothetical protein [Oceanipulchritudo sp.]